MSTRHAHLTAFGTGLAFASLAVIAIRVSPMTSGFAFLWPSTAVLVVRMANRPIREWWAMLVACMAIYGGLLAAAQVPGRIVGWLLLANIAEAFSAALFMRHLLRAGTPRALPNDEIGWLMRLIFGISLAPPALGGLIVWGGVTHFSTPGWMLARDYALGHALGLMILLPCLARMQRLRHHYRTLLMRWRAPWRWSDAAALGFPALMAASAILSFAMSTRPLLFLPVLVLVAAMLWIELITLTWMYLLLAAIAAIMTEHGFSPLALMHVPMPQQMASVQAYMLMTVCCVTPITGLVHQLRRSLAELRESEARYRLLADNSTDIIMSSGLDGRVRFVSPSVLALAQRQPSDVIGHRAMLLVDPPHRRRVAEAHMRAATRPGETVVVEFAGMPMIGPSRWYEAHMRAVAGHRGQAECVVTVVRDMSERKRMESALTEAAFTDPLTGLPNRRALMEAMERCIANGQTGSLAVIDLDHFKQVNDSFGHSAGDEVLRSFAHVARQGLRATDVLARIGGEEFALLLPGAEIAIGERICNRIGSTLARTVTRHGEASILVTSSMGLAVLGDDAAAALDAADKALYIAKAHGRARLQVAA